MTRAGPRGTGQRRAAHVLDAADRLGLNVWRGRHLAVRAGWMTEAGEVTPEGRRLACEQGWRDREGVVTQRTWDVLAVDSDDSCMRLTADTGQFAAWSPLTANPRAVRTWDCRGRGRRPCPMCKRYIAFRRVNCSCGVVFLRTRRRLMLGYKEGRPAGDTAGVPEPLPVLPGPEHRLVAHPAFRRGQPAKRIRCGWATNALLLSSCPTLSETARPAAGPARRCRVAGAAI